MFAFLVFLTCQPSFPQSHLLPLLTLISQLCSSKSCSFFTPSQHITSSAAFFTLSVCSYSLPTVSIVLHFYLSWYLCSSCPLSLLVRKAEITPIHICVWLTISFLLNYFMSLGDLWKNPLKPLSRSFVWKPWKKVYTYSNFLEYPWID